MSANADSDTPTYNYDGSRSNGSCNPITTLNNSNSTPPHRKEEIFNISDTQKPTLDIEFIDTSTGMAITAINSPRVSYVEVRLNSMDICDDSPTVAGVAQPVTAVMGGEVIKIKGNIQDVDMPTTAIEVTANATDDSGNKAMDQSILKINTNENVS